LAETITIVAISHQPAIKAVADQILEVSGGEVSEVGRPVAAGATDSEQGG
jgi:ABC-type siderophore export system fused ATPase/permease subunit